MSIFDATIDASLNGERPRFVVLCELAFNSGSMYLWTGRGSRTFGGQAWTGFGALLSIEGLQQAINGVAPETKIQIAATEEIANTAFLEFKTEALQRRLNLSLQFLNQSDDTPLGTPWRIWSGLMQAVSYSAAPEAAHSLTLSVESLASLRTRPRFSMLSHAEQQRRYPADKGLEFVNSIRNKEVTWPDF